MAAEDDNAEDGGKEAGGSGAPSFVIGVVIPAVVAAAAAFGGAFAAKAAQPDPAEIKKQEEEAAKMPGPTVQLKAFVFNAFDAEKASHAVKLTLAVELSSKADPDLFNRYRPRLRDAALEYLRNVTFEEIRDNRKTTRFTRDLLAKFHASGATQVTRVLMQDLVAQ
jgi:flagellar basal body-associated protein FliL